jgi:hypothetical protein
MAIDASGVLGSRQLAGVKVNRRGYAWNLARNQSGNLAADIVLGGQPHPGRAETPPFRLAYLGAGGVAELTIGQMGGAVLCFVVAIPAAWYDYRIWTLKARRLFLIF